MPHARIDMHKSLQPKMADISAAILRGMVTGFEMPADDLFQIFRLHEPGELVYSPTFPNQQRDDIVFIELVASKGYKVGFTTTDGIYIQGVQLQKGDCTGGQSARVYLW